MYEIIFNRAAFRELNRLPVQIIHRITRAIETLQEDPFPPGCRKIQGSTNKWRIRVGDYRVIYQVEDDELQILIIRVRHRRDVYRG